MCVRVEALRRVRGVCHVVVVVVVLVVVLVVVVLVVVVMAGEAIENAEGHRVSSMRTKLRRYQGGPGASA